MRGKPHWIAPFGNLRIKVCLPLPEAYRSLPRPSSPDGAKASVVRPYTLCRTVGFAVLADLKPNPSGSVYVAFSQKHSIAKDQKSLRGPFFWWRQPGSNRRHPACKAGALPTELCPLLHRAAPSSAAFCGMSIGPEGVRQYKLVRGSPCRPVAGRRAP